MKKQADFWSSLGGVAGKVVNLPVGVVAGTAAALYFTPKIINMMFQARQAHNTGESVDSLRNLEITNQEMVRTLQAQMPAARPRKDTYPYV